MSDPVVAFDTAAGAMPWGLTLAEAITRTRAAVQPMAPRWATASGGEFFGLQVAEIELGASRMDRPVTQVFYGLSLPAECEHMDFIGRAHAQLIDRWGRPSHGDLAAKADGEISSSHVVANAEWRRGSVRIGVSWFGEPRLSAQQRVSGTLYLDWDEEQAVARPYMPAWQEGQSQLEALPGPQVEVMARLHAPGVSARIWRWFHFDAPDPSLSTDLQAAQRALYAPSLFFTPLSLIKALQLRTDELIAWRCATHTCWGLSHAFDTVCMREDEAATLDWRRIRPARGEGGHVLTLNNLVASWPYGDARRAADIQKFCDRVALQQGVVLATSDESDS